MRNYMKLWFSRLIKNGNILPSDQLQSRQYFLTSILKFKMRITSVINKFYSGNMHKIELTAFLTCF